MKLQGISPPPPKVRLLSASANDGHHPNLEICDPNPSQRETSAWLMGSDRLHLLFGHIHGKGQM